VQLCHTIDLVAADDGEVCHSDHLWLRLFNDRDPTKHLAILGEVAFNVLQEVQVDVVDDLEVARQEVLEERDGPLLQCFRQNSVVGVAEGGLDDGPCLVPLQTLLVDQNALKLGDSECRMCVVQLRGLSVFCRFTNLTRQGAHT
jgi:hypothetical protein